MSERKIDYQRANDACEDEIESLYELNLNDGSSHHDGKNVAFGGANGRKDPGMFEEDGDAGSISVFQSTRTPMAASPRPSPEIVAPVKPIDKPQTSSTPKTNERRIPITSTMPPTFPSPSAVPTVFNAFKKWSLNTFKYTKQYVAERLGQTPRTIDPETEAQVESLRETQRQYLHILRLARALYVHFSRMVQTQRVLGEAFGDLSQKNAELCDQFAYNAETQKLLSRNGETLLGTLNAFMISLSTLCNTTIEDTLTTVKNYQAARIQFDADRHYWESLRQQQRDAAAIAKAQEAERVFQRTKQRFDRLHNDLIIKLKFLDENKISVCQKHLYLLHRGFMSYVSGNREGVDEILRHIHENSKPKPNSVVAEKATSASSSSDTTLTPCHSQSSSSFSQASCVDACHAASSDAHQSASE